MFSLILLSTLILAWVGTPVGGLSLQSSSREQLIYEFAINYKQIRRLSLLSCSDGGVRNQKQTLVHGGKESGASPTMQRVKTLHGLFLAAGVLIKVVPIEGTLHCSHSCLEEVFRSEDFRQLIVLDLSCGNASLRILQMASDRGLLNPSYHWLLMEDYSVNRPDDEQKDKKDAALIEFLTKLNINMNTELTLARKIDQDPDQEDYFLFDVWNPGWQFGGKLNVTEVGRFSQCNGLQMYDWFKRTTTIVRRMDMKNVPIRCMIVVTNKFTGLLEDYLNSDQDSHLDSMHRFNYALLSHVRDMFNFRIRLYHTNSWGYLRNNTYDGMIGALVRREVDIGGSPIFYRLERAKVIDSTARTWIARPCFIFRQPNARSSLSRIIFLRPFSNEVWISVLGCGLAIIVLLWRLGRAEQDALNETSLCGNKSIEKIPKHYRVLSAKVGSRSEDGGVAHDGHGGGAESACAPEIKWGTRNNRQGTNIQVETVKTASKVKTSRGFLRDIICRSFKKSFSRHKSKLSIQGYWSSINGGNTNYDRSQNNSMISAGGVSYGRSYASHQMKDDDVMSNNGEWGNDEFQVKKEIRNHSKDTQKKESHLSRWNFNKDSHTTSSILQDCTLFFIGTLCQQGTSFPASFWSLRCIIFSTLMFSFFINQFYSASIVGTLLMEKPQQIKNLRDLIDSSLRVGIEDIPYNRDYFQRTTDPDAIELYWRKVSFYPGGTRSTADGDEQQSSKDDADVDRTEKPFGASTVNAPATWRKTTSSASSGWHNPEEGLKLMKAGGYAFHVDVATAYKIITETFSEQEICELTEIQLFPPQKMVNIVQKGSPLRKMITYGLRRISEAGLMDRQRKVWHSPKPQCVKKIEQKDLRVGMQTFMSAVFILICGAGASVAILALEVMHDLWAKSSISIARTRNN